MKIARKSPELLILIMTVGAGISWAVWLNLLNNFAIEKIDFSGAEIGILQSLREVPGLLAFTVIFVLAFSFVTMANSYAVNPCCRPLLRLIFCGGKK